MDCQKFNAAGLNVLYYSTFLDIETADELFNEFKKLDFYIPSSKIREIKPPQKIIAFSDEGVSYTFSNLKISGLVWSEPMRTLKEKVEQVTGSTYNFALLNYYEDGASSIAPHKESSLDAAAPMPTVSLGMERRMDFSRAGYPDTSVPLQHGSMVIMHPPTNSLYTHAIPVDRTVKESSISVTFRNITSESPLKRVRISSVRDDCNNLKTVSNLKILFSRKLSEHSNICIFMQNLNVRVQICDAYQAGVFLTPRTFVEFSEKINDFNLKYTDSCFLCNNQLVAFCVNNEFCQLQQIYRNFDKFNLKGNDIKLFFNEISQLRELIPEIKNKLIETILIHNVRENILYNLKSCSVENHGSVLSTREQIMTLFAEKMTDLILKFFKCFGCLNNLPAQNAHECVTESANWKFHTVKYQVISSLNIKTLSKEFCEKKCTCFLNEHFFDNLFIDDYMSFFDTYFE